MHVECASLALGIERKWGTIDAPGKPSCALVAAIASVDAQTTTDRHDPKVPVEGRQLLRCRDTITTRHGCARIGDRVTTDGRRGCPRTPGPSTTRRYH